MAATVGEIQQHRDGEWFTVLPAGDPLGLSAEQRAASDRAAALQRSMETTGRPLDRLDRWLVDFVAGAA